MGNPAVDEFAERTLVASVTRAVPMKALQWGEFGRPVVFVAFGVETLFEVLAEARPVPIAALQ